MCRRILVVNGHPDPRPGRFCAALCDAYEFGARMGGCGTRRIDVASLRLEALARSADPAPLARLEQVFRLMRAADRLAIVYPLWADGPPDDVKRLFDYAARLRSTLEPGVLDGEKQARIVVTTALPAFIYRDRCHPDLNGVAAGKPLFIGSVETISTAQRTRWLAQLRDLGEMAN